MPTYAQDNQGRYELRIEGGSLGQVVEDVHDQSGFEFIYSFDLVDVDGIKPVSGQYTLQEALDIMFEGTGLSGGLTESGMIVITRDKNAVAPSREETEVNKRTKQSLLAGVSALIFGTTAQGAALAQDAPEAEEEVRREDTVYITATKRETGIQDTAITISAITEDALKNGAIESVEDYIESIPGATFVDRGPGLRYLVLRGVASNSGGNGLPTATSYIDEYSLRALSLPIGEIGLLDMQRIEVLKGPQGTVYGQSAMGGVVRYITNKPTTEAYEGGVNLEYSDTRFGESSTRINGHLNVPLSDSFAVRAVGYNNDNGGFIDDIGLGEADVNSHETWGGRLAARWDISPQGMLDVQYVHHESDVGHHYNSAGSFAVTNTYDLVGGAPTNFQPPNIDDPTALSNTPSFSGQKLSAFNSTLEWDFGPFTAQAIGSVKNFEFFESTDTFRFIDILDGTAADNSIMFESDSETLELRAVSEASDSFEWILGLYYENEEVDRSQFAPVTVALTPPTLGIPEGFVFFDNDQFFDQNELALYGDVRFNLSDKLGVSLGYRWSDVEVSNGTDRADGLADTVEVGLTRTTEEQVSTYKLSVDYAINDDLFLYALASSGYRPGGILGGSNLAGIPPVPFESDSLWNFELGVKTSWFDDKLIANLSAYRIDWSDIQLAVFDPVALINVIDNAGEARIHGVEAETRFRPNSEFEIGAAYAFVDAELTEDYIDPLLGLVAPDGARLPGSAKHSLSIYADWNRQLTESLELNVHGDYRFVGERLEDFNTSFGDLPSYELVDFSIGVSHESGVDLSLFVDNAFDERAVYFRYPLGTLVEVNTINRPRTMGIRAGYSF